MAKQANSENIKRDEQGPDFDAAIGLIRGQIRTNQSDAAGIAQDNSTYYKRIEKQMGVHRGAAKDFAKIDGMAPEKRVDYLRSLLGLCAHAGYDQFDDLVDKAQRPSAVKDKAKKTTKPAPDATNGGLAAGERIDLKTGMIVRDDGDDGEIDVREATPAELAAERERTADFDDNATDKTEGGTKGTLRVVN